MSKKEALLKAAEDKVRLGGYDNFSFRELASEVGINHANGKNPINEYTQLFRNALLKDNKMCLCGLLGAQGESLPDKVRQEVQRFFEKNLAWLSEAHTANGESNPKQAAITTISLLEGAMMISKALNDHSHFELATQ